MAGSELNEKCEVCDGRGYIGAPEAAAFGKAPKCPVCKGSGLFVEIGFDALGEQLPPSVYEELDDTKLRLVAVEACVADLHVVLAACWDEFHEIMPDGLYDEAKRALGIREFMATPPETTG